MGLDKLSADVIDTWEMLLRAKLMGTAEKAIDVLAEELEGSYIEHKEKDGTLTKQLVRDMKSAKLASEIFQTVFNSFRLSTGKSTENTNSTITKFNEVIESKRKLTQPNQSLRELNNVPAV